MSTKKRDLVSGKIVAAAIDILRSEGIAALTQPRVAAAARMRQSHLTYYFPTRSDLIAAVAESVAGQLRAAFAAAFATKAPGGMAESIARIGTPEQTRLLLALVLEAEREPAVRTLFRRLTKDVRAAIASGLLAQGITAGDEAVAAIHALGIGLAVLDLARAEPRGRREVKAAMAFLMNQQSKLGRERA